MGLISDILNLNRLQNDLIRAEAKAKRDGRKIRSISDYEKVFKIINKKGFEYGNITLNDLMGISEKYGLRWSEEEVIKVMESEEPFYNFTLLPMPRFLLSQQIYDEVYDMFMERNIGLMIY